MRAPSSPSLTSAGEPARRRPAAVTRLLATKPDRTASCGARTVYKRPAHGTGHDLWSPAAAAPQRSMPRFGRLSLAGPPVLLRAVIGGLVLLVVSESVTSMPTKSTPEWRRISDEAYFSDLLYPCSDDLPQVQPAGPPTDTFAIEYVKILGERTTACLGHASKLLAVVSGVRQLLTLLHAALFHAVLAAARFNPVPSQRL
nr:uncharacterized protein LOC126545482 [Dermacentor andersoni]